MTGHHQASASASSGFEGAQEPAPHLDVSEELEGGLGFPEASDSLHQQLLEPGGLTI